MPCGGVVFNGYCLNHAYPKGIFFGSILRLPAMSFFSSFSVAKYILYNTHPLWWRLENWNFSAERHIAIHTHTYTEKKKQKDAIILLRPRAPTVPDRETGPGQFYCPLCCDLLNCYRKGFTSTAQCLTKDRLFAPPFLSFCSSCAV